MRPERVCPLCGDSKNEEDEYCNFCEENGSSSDDEPEEDVWN